jgi:hypothetical protein
MVAKPPMQCNLEVAQQGLTDTVRWISEAAINGTAAHVVERQLLRRMLSLGSLLFEGFIREVGPGDAGPTMTLKDGLIVNRLPEQHSRRLVTVFGEFSIPRYVYPTRQGQKIELAPTDQRLQLPGSAVSYLLQEWDQMLGIEHAFGRVGHTLRTIAGLKQPVDTLERGNRQMAEAAPAFRAAQPAPDPEAEGSILVGTVDNKGVPMVRPVASVPAGTHRKKGEKANKKQMACIACVHTVNPHVRTPEEMISILYRDPGRQPEDTPQAIQKRYWSELTREVAGRTVRGQEEVFKHMASDIALRRKPGQILLHLCDGQNSLETDRWEYLPTDENTVEILDLMHVLPRMWEAAHLFNDEGSDEAKAFVRERLPYVLNGCTADVIAEFRRLGSEHGLRGANAKRLKKLCAFLEKNLHRMKYDEYLKAGYPIATGVIEGACRHVIKDRMERAGMRWKVPGAHAMLQLRAISANGDWEAFLEFRIQYENARLYPHKEIEAVPWPIAA